MALLRKVVGEELEGYGRTAGNSQIVDSSRSNLPCWAEVRNVSSLSICIA